MAETLTELPRLDRTKIGAGEYKYGQFHTTFGTLHSTHPRRFGWPNSAAGQAQRTLEMGMLFGHALSLEAPRPKAAMIKQLSREVGEKNVEAVMVMRETQRSMILARKALALNELLELSDTKYYVFGEQVSSDQLSQPTTVVSNKGIVAKLAGFATVEASEGRHLYTSAHIEPVVYTSSEDGETGLLPENFRLHHSPLFFIPSA